MTAPSLRPYQVQAVEAIRTRYLAGDRSTLLVLPTGTGKTVVFAECARRTVARGGRALVLAHRTELIGQAAKKLEDVGILAGVEKGSQRALHAATPVVVASVQTLKGKRLEAWPTDAFRLVVVDEAHHAVAKGYRDILAHFASAHVLGVTATPDRLDGAALGLAFDSCAYRYELRQAIRDEYLVPLRAKRIVLDRVDFSGVHTRAGDMATDELSAILAREEQLHGVAVPLLEQSGDRPTIAFAVDVAHAHALAEVLNRYEPGEARAIDGTASDQERTHALRDFRDGKFRILVNCALFTEGFDEPAVACIAIIRPTKSRALYTQMVGRGTRLHPSKVDCLILDFTGISGRHRLITPADVLAGTELPAELHEILEAKMADELDLEAELALQEAEETQRARQLELAVRAIATYQAQEVDPFLDDIPAMTDVEDAPQALPAQLELLAKYGLEKPPPTLTRARAAWWLDALRVRREKGLCTLKQARYLKRLGHPNPKAVTFVEAGPLIDRYLARVRGKPQEDTHA